MGVSSEKLFLLAAIGATTIASIVLVCIRDVKITGGFYNFVQKDRSSITSIFALVGGSLGAMQIYVAASLFKFWTRIQLKKGPTTLGDLYLWMAVQAASLNTLSIKGFTICAVLWASSKAGGPAALWQGALAPTDATAVRHNGFIDTPIFTSSTKYVWDQQFRQNISQPEPRNIQNNCTSINNQVGFVSNCPVPDIQGSLLTSASSATTLSGAVRNHSKIDNPSWSFKGRSYGVASSQGVVSLQFDGRSPRRLLTYTYNETGYLATVTCIKNLSSAFGLYLEEYTEHQKIAVWRITGSLPNSGGDSTHYPSISWGGDNFGDNSVLGWHAFSNPEADDRNMIGIAATEPYVNLNKTQCKVVFKPQAFIVTVNVSEQSIAVNPCSNCTGVVDIEPTGRLTEATMWSINLLSRMTHSLYESVLGNTLERNVANLLNRPGLNITTEEATLQAISDSFTAMIDDILVAFGTAQLALANASTTTPLVATIPAVKIGGSAYVFAALGVNSCLLLLVAVLAVWTMLWRDLPKFDYTDTKTMIAASDGSIFTHLKLEASDSKAKMKTEIQLVHDETGENAVWKLGNIHQPEFQLEDRGQNGENAVLLANGQ